MDWRHGFWVATNFTSTLLTIPASARAQIVVGSREVPPGGAEVWVE